MRQMTFDEVPEPGDRAESPMARIGGELPTAARGMPSPGSEDLLSRALARSNMEAALRRVESNRGSAGIDGMTSDELRPWLKENWPRIRAELEAERFEPSPVRWHAIPKDGGG